MLYRLILYFIFITTTAHCSHKETGLPSATQNQLSHSKFKEFTIVSKIDSSQNTLTQLKEKENTLFVESFKADFQQAQKLMSERKSQIYSQYQPHSVAYPGVISNVSECASKYKPRAYDFNAKSIQVIAFEMFANDRFTFGACLPGQIQYRALYIMVACIEQKLFFDLKVFFADHQTAIDIDLILKGFQCHAP